MKSTIPVRGRRSTLLSTLCLLTIGTLAGGCTTKETQLIRPEPLTIEGVPVVGGQLMIFNDPGVYFTFVMPGEHFHNVPGGGRPLTMLVDSIHVQMTTVDANDVVGDAEGEMTHAEVLARHQAWETEFLAKQAGDDELGLYREHITLPNGRGCLVWTIDTPGRPTHLFLTTVVGTRVLVLTGLVELVPSTDIIERFIGAAESIERHRHPIDVRYIRDSVAGKRRGG